MFKLFVLTLCFATLAVVLSVPVPDQVKYTTKYDDINIDEILGNERLFNSYYKCIMDEGACTPEGTELRKIIPDAVQTNCGGCSEKQKEGSKKILKFLIDTKQEQWKALEKKYDPTGVYYAKYSKEYA